MGHYNNLKETGTTETVKQLHSTNSSFRPETKEEKIDENSLAFTFVGAKLLLIDSNVPLYERIQEFKLNIRFTKYIGKIHDTRCYTLDIDQDEEFITLGTLVGLRQLYTLLPEYHLKAAIYGFQIVLWNNKNKYCGQCGSSTEEGSPNILVKLCPNCKEEYYPKISPSVIVAVINKDKILLAQHKRMTKKMYTVLAGFVNPGETLEECIHREIKEETGVEVANIRYFGSQPWPFPDSLMIGFIADYVKGELIPDKEEITELKWFEPKEIPEWPDKASIARALIDYFIDSNYSMSNNKASP